MDIIGRIRKIFAADKPPEPAAVPRGEVGLASPSYLYAGRDFSKYAPDLLYSTKGAQVYDRMMTDDQVKAVLEFKQSAIVSRGWYFDVETDPETDEENEEQRKIADFFDAVLNKMDGSVIDKLIEILSAIKYGFSITEKVFQPIAWDGTTYWGLKDLKTRPFSTLLQSISTDIHGNITAIRQKIGAKDIELPLDKIIHFVHRPEIDRHYGESDLRAAYRSWWSKDIAIKFQNIHLERAAGGFIWAGVDLSKGTLTPTDSANLQKILKNINAQAGIQVPASVTLNAIQPLRTDAYERAVAQHDKAIAKALLVPNLLGLSEQGETGSYSQSKVHLRVFFWILDLCASRLEEALNEQLFKPLAEWNFGTDEFPLFRFEPISEEEKERITNMWGNLVQKGAVTKTETDEAHIRKLIGFPEKGEEEQEQLGPGGLLPDMTPEEMEPVEKPNNQEVIAKQPEEKVQQVKKEFEERPWLNRCNFIAIEGLMNTQDKSLSEQLSNIMAKVKAVIIAQVTRIGGERSWGNVAAAEIVDISIPKNLMTQFRKALRECFADVIETSYEQARRELPKKMFAKVKPGMDKTQTEKFLASRAMKITGVVENKVLDSVQNVLENSIRYDKSLKDTIAAIEEDTELLTVLPRVDSAGRAVNVPARLENIARTNISDAVNQARMSLFQDPELKGFVQAFEYSAILDDRTTEICQSLHGKIQRDWGSYAPPNHYQCRSLLIPVTEIDDWSGKEDRIPASAKPMKGFA